MTKPVASWFFNVFWYFAAFLASCITVPRIGGVAYEVGYGGVFDASSKITTFIFLTIFFAVVFYFTCDKNNIVDKVGKLLTPVLLVILIVIIVTGFVKPIGAPVGGEEKAFSSAFLEAYNIGDLVTGLLCAGIFLTSIKANGHTSQKQMFSMTLKSVFVAFLGLFFVYGGLCYIGATASGTLSPELDQTTLLVTAVNMLLGKGGMIAFSVCTILACLTTAIGIAATVADFIERRTNGKVKFKYAVLGICILDIFLASGGVAFLIQMAAPIFLLLYPVAIIMVALTLGNKFVPNDGAMKGGVLMAGIIGIYDALSYISGTGMLNIPLGAASKVYNIIPLSQYGFAWLIPSIIGIIVGALIYRAVKGKSEKVNG